MIGNKREVGITAQGGGFRVVSGCLGTCDLAVPRLG